MFIILLKVTDIAETD